MLLAEGLRAESYLETGDRSNFANGGVLVRLFADFSAQKWETLGCAPLIVTGPKLGAVRRLIAERATRRHSHPADIRDKQTPLPCTGELSCRSA
jgi:collagen type I/II/III/V/XI/XXIV/XXVII alpha